LVFDLTVLSRGEEFLSSRGVAFTAKNVAEDTTARDELIAKTGRLAVPVITVDDEVIVGFDRGRLQRLLGR
jgi:glutaredoxin 3